MGITPYRLALNISVPQTRIADIVHERRSVTADTACRLAAYFGTSAEFWMGLQSLYDLEEARLRLSGTLEHIQSAAAVG